MEQNKLENEHFVFRVMVTSVESLREVIVKYNLYTNTNFEIVNIIEDEIPFCDIRVSKFVMADVFGLGFSLARYEQKLREDGKIDW